MNSTITFNDVATFKSALTALEMEATPIYSADRDNLTITTDNVDEIVDILVDHGVYEGANVNDEPDQFRTDAEADADALASAGFGTDEDYGYYGGGEDE